MITPHASLVCFLYAGIPSSFSRSASRTTVRRSSNWRTLLSIGVNSLSQCRVHNGGGVHCLCCSSLIVSKHFASCSVSCFVRCRESVHSPPDSATRPRVNAACCIGDIFNLVARDTTLGRLTKSCGMKTFVPVFLCLGDV